MAGWTISLSRTIAASLVVAAQIGGSCKGSDTPCNARVNSECRNSDGTKILVRAGEQVWVEACRAGIRVRAAAKSLDGGSRGDIVRWSSLSDGSSHRRGRVVGLGRLAVEVATTKSRPTDRSDASSRNRSCQPLRHDNATSEAQASEGHPAVILDEQSATIAVVGDVDVGTFAIAHKALVVEIGPYDLVSADMYTWQSYRTSIHALLQVLDLLQVQPKDAIEIVKSLHYGGQLWGELVIK